MRQVPVDVQLRNPATGHLRDGCTSPLRKTAPNARPVRRKGDQHRQVS